MRSWLDACRDAFRRVLPRGQSGNEVQIAAVADSLSEAEREGFRLAVIGRTCALVAVAVFYFGLINRFPLVLAIPGVILAAALVGLIPLGLVGTRYERGSRYALFAFDVAVLSAVLAVAPLSSSGDIPQNFVFLSSRGEYYFVAIALATLTLSPAIVLWTGLCSVLGLASATLWIMSRMDRIVTFADLPAAPSREAFLSVALDSAFLATSTRVSEAVKLALVTVIVALAVQRARAVVGAHAVVQIERGRIERLFGRYVPAQVAEQLLRSGELAPRTRDASVLFADIAGFTQLSESMAPAEIVDLLNEFFTAASAVVDAHGGVVVNYVGDALIAAFNAPLPADDYPRRAIACARALLTLVAARDFAGHRLRLRVGIATGTVAAGTVGSPERQAYTLYGDTVNLAQRLEQMNKELGTLCVVCAKTFDAAVSAAADATAIGTVRVRGRAEPLDVYAIEHVAYRSDRGPGDKNEDRG